MIVPAPRILGLFAATVLPLSVVSAVLPESRTILAGAGIFLCLMAIIDAWLAGRMRRRIVLEFPQRLNLSRDHEETLIFNATVSGGADCSVVLALQLPPGFSSPHQEHGIRLTGAEPSVRIQWPLTGGRRGNFRLERCRLRLRSPLGLWFSQATLTAETDLRVYPNLREERKRLAALFLNRNSALIHPRRQVGQGREFEKLRLYLPGDSMGDIHWRATAKRGQLVTKEFQIERTQEVYVVIDASRLSSRPGNHAGMNGRDRLEEPVLERYITTALILGSVAQKQGDLFGVLAFSDRVLSFVRAKSGKGHFGICRDALYNLTPNLTNPGYDEVFSFLAARLKRRALVIFLTSLDEPALAEGFVRSARVLSRRHLVCVAMLRPEVAVPLFSGGNVKTMEDMYRSLGGHMIWHGLQEMQRTLRLQGVQLSLVDDGRLSAEVVSRYLDVKRRQML